MATAAPKKKTSQEKPTRAVKLDVKLVTRAQGICRNNGRKISEYLSDILRPTIERDWKKVMTEIEDKTS